MSGKSIFKHFLYRLEYGALLTLSSVFRILPPGALYGFARGLGLFVFDCLRIRRDVTLENLRGAFGAEKTEKELERIARESYISITIAFAEMLLFPELHDRLLDMVDLEEVRLVREAMARGRGVILVAGHFGNWELNGASIATSGIPAVVVAKRQSNPYVDAWITRYRIEFKMNIIGTGAPVKHLVRALRNGEAAGLISDQDAGSRGVFVPFFGRPASTARGAAELALRYVAPLLVCMTPRMRQGKYKTLVREVEIRSDDTVETLTARYTKVMEDIIRLYPEQYFWMHRRWKTRPGSLVDRLGEGGETAEPKDSEGTA